MKTTYLFAAAAIATFAAFGAHAGEAEYSQNSQNFSSTRTAADVQAEALKPVRITNGGTGYVGQTDSAKSSASVRTEGAMAARAGTTSRGEM